MGGFSCACRSFRDMDFGTGMVSEMVEMEV
jgi:hypothetical protein